MQKRYRYVVFLLLIAALYWAWNRVTQTSEEQKVVFKPAQQTCKTIGALRYCMNRAVAGSNDDVIYHLHGRNLDEQVWNDDTYFTAMLQAQWQKTGAVPPVVITVSYGPTWLLTYKGKQPSSGLLEDLMAHIPEIETEAGLTPRHRILLGESMGGLNVLIAGLSHPTSFAKVAALCPGVYVDSPFSSLSVLRRAMRSTGANPKIIVGIVLMARKYVADDAEWARVSPLRLVERADAAYPALYLSCGLYDDYGNYEGTQRLAQIARQHGELVEWHPIYGGHCAVDISSLANFLLH